MNVITLAKTKELLGIAVTDYDAQITAIIPEIDSKVKQIIRNNYNWLISGNTVSGSPYVEVNSFTNYTYSYYTKYCKTNSFVDTYRQDYYKIDDLAEYIQIGQLITGPGIASDSYVKDIIRDENDRVSITLNSTDYIMPVIELNANATATATNVDMFLGIPIGFQRTIAKGIWWLIGETSTNIVDTVITSRTLGKHSVSYSEKESEINGKYGMPNWFVKAFPKFMRGH